MTSQFDEDALEYHRYPTPGKIEVIATKPLSTQRDLALAYSPGVAAACNLIVKDRKAAAEMTSRGNLVGVISNGTAVLGLGAIGPLASKPVMEGKAVLFKKFAGVDVFDIEINESDPNKLVDIIASLEPTFGGINLEDIKAPECFVVESKLRERMSIPVFHDDQHGTAIICCAGMLNGLKIIGKKLAGVQLVTSGAGAAGIACLDLLVAMGLPIENITITDRHGVAYKGRSEEMDERKARYAKETDKRTLDEVIAGADIFLGVSVGGILKPEMVKKMAKNPIIFALANPEPEILPELAKEARPDAIIATGRSDYPNQVNNVLCFPYIFRGALDVGATTINEEMKIACVKALAELAEAEISELVTNAYGHEQPSFGPDYLIPTPFDPRLIVEVASAVAQAAMDTGVAERPIKDINAYRQQLTNYVFKSELVMRPIFDRAKENPKRVCYADGEEKSVLQAVQTVIDEGMAQPILIGRPEVINARIKELGLRIKLGVDFDVVNPQSDPRFHDYWTHYHSLLERKGVTPAYAKVVVSTNNTVIASLLVLKGEADALICGVTGRYKDHLEHVLDIIGRREDVSHVTSLSAVMLPKGVYFICDTYITPEPSAEEIAEMTCLAADEVRQFGITPKVALLSHSNFGAAGSKSARNMRKALKLLGKRCPELEVEGEMHADAAVNEGIREKIFPNSTLKGSANLLIMPNLDSANISFNLLKVLGNGISVGPILLGVDKPCNILTPSASVRRIINMTALSVVDAQREEPEETEEPKEA